MKLFSSCFHWLLCSSSHRPSSTFPHHLPLLSYQVLSGKLTYTYFSSHLLLINIIYGTMIYNMIANFFQPQEQKLNFGTQIMSSDSAISLLKSPIIVSMITTILITIPLNSIYECVMCIWQVGFGGVGVDFLAVVPSFPSPDAKIRTTEFKVFPLHSFLSSFFYYCSYYCYGYYYNWCYHCLYSAFTTPQICDNFEHITPSIIN